MYKDNGSFVRMEKKATNKIGLFLLFLVVIAAIGGGIYFYINNKDKINFDFTLPWKKETKKQEEEKKAEEKKKLELAIERKKVEISNESIYKGNEILLTPTSISYDQSSGYTISLVANNTSSNNININIKNITIDGYQTDLTLNISLSPNEVANTLLQIPISTLDLYRIEEFSEISLITDITKGYEKIAENSNLQIKSVNTSENVTKIKDLTRLGSTSNFEVSYYKIESDNDYYNIYLDFKNTSKDKNFTFNIRKMLINDKLYEDKEFKTEVYYQSEKINILKIPKKDFSEIDKLTFSFFAIDKNDIYMTEDKTIEV